MIATTFINGLGMGLLLVLSVILGVVGIVLVVLSLGIDHKKEKITAIFLGILFVVIAVGAFIFNVYNLS
tara:strand:+ start:1062 stop:1268 length:207 start_codon:yes stop_codon:yes gene_type:complete